MESGRHAERVLAPDGHEGVEPSLGEVLQDSLDAPLEPERVRAAGADDGSAARQDPRDLLGAEILEQRLDEAAPALPRRDHLPAGGVGAPHDGADDRVQARAVAAPGEDAEALGHETSLDPRGRRMVVMNDDAEGGTRTHTARRPPDFES